MADFENESSSLDSSEFSNITDSPIHCIDELQTSHFRNSRKNLTYSQEPHVNVDEVMSSLDRTLGDGQNDVNADGTANKVKPKDQSKLSTDDSNRSIPSTRSSNSETPVHSKTVETPVKLAKKNPYRSTGIKKLKTGVYLSHNFRDIGDLPIKKPKKAEKRVIRDNPKQENYRRKIILRLKKCVRTYKKSKSFSPKLDKEIGNSEYREDFVKFIRGNLSILSKKFERLKLINNTTIFEFFKDKTVARALELMVFAIFYGKNCLQLSNFFGFKCCEGDAHTKECYKKWTSFWVYIYTSMVTMDRY